MLIAGLTGGLASGKSFVAAEFRKLGAHVVEADELGHQALLQGSHAYALVIKDFGPDILNQDASINRAKLGAMVFRDPGALARLNAIVHPAVHLLAQQHFDAIGTKDPSAIVIYIAAILVETGGYKQSPWLIVTKCTREQQIERALQRPGATLADVEARLARQLPLEQKLALATHIIDTGGTPEETRRQTKIVFEDLCLKQT